jgi:hypothetical protein
MFIPVRHVELKKNKLSCSNVKEQIKGLPPLPIHSPFEIQKCYTLLYISNLVVPYKKLAAND